MIALQVWLLLRQNSIITGQSAIMAGQREAAEAQSGYMRDGLTEARKAADAAQRSADLAERTVEITQRAHCHITQPGFPGIDKSIGPKAVTFNVVNDGNTPAENARVTYTVEMRDGTLPGEPEYAREEMRIGTITPGQSDIWPLWNIDESMTLESLREAAKRDRHLCLWGRLTYTDLFGKAWEAGFAYWFDAKSKVFMHIYQDTYSYYRQKPSQN